MPRVLSILDGMAANGVPHVAKYLWTDDDFEAMGWHDVIVHAFRSEPGDHAVTSASDRLLFDLDYIVKWVVEQPLNGISCWLLPATLVFEDVGGLTPATPCFMSVSALTVSLAQSRRRRARANGRCTLESSEPTTPST